MQASEKDFELEYKRMKSNLSVYCNKYKYIKKATKHKPYLYRVKKDSRTNMKVRALRDEFDKIYKH